MGIVPGAFFVTLPIHTVGHSTLDLEDFLALLAHGGIEQVVDVRRFPGSRRFPHFNLEALRDSLPRAGVGYRHAPALGGRRATGRRDSINTWWDNASFRAYADHALTDEFADALGSLLQLATDHRCAVMCSEAVWWRCHRRIIADHLLARGVEVRHLIPPGTVSPAEMTPAARRLPDGRPYYPIDDLFGPPLAPARTR